MTDSASQNLALMQSRLFGWPDFSGAPNNYGRLRGDIHLGILGCGGPFTWSPTSSTDVELGSVKEQIPSPPAPSPQPPAPSPPHLRLSRRKTSPLHASAFPEANQKREAGGTPPPRCRPPPPAPAEDPPPENGAPKRIRGYRRNVDHCSPGVVSSLDKDLDVWSSQGISGPVELVAFGVESTPHKRGLARMFTWLRK